MIASIKQRLLSLAIKRDSFNFIKIFETLYRNQILEEINLTGGASATVTTGIAGTAVVGGSLVSIANGASMAALNGPTVTTAVPYQVWLLTVDKLGNFYTYPGVPATSLAAVQIPTMDPSKDPQVAIGFITMNNASVGNFVPGTTLLNVANLNIVYNNIQGPFYPIATV